MIEDLQHQIMKLKKEKNACIVAHHYQTEDIQQIADFVGDSLALSKIAKQIKEDMIIFCGVKFMAETAKILSPHKKVILPVMEAGCPMADMVTPEQLRLVKKQYPHAEVVCYVNSSAEVKAESDICCTSSNAVSVINHLDAKQILFVPDQHLGAYAASQVKDKDIILWQGYCIVHHQLREEQLLHIKEKYPNAPILVHPECRPHIVRHADFVGSTAQIIDKARSIEQKQIIIGTERGVLYTLKKQNPHKEFILLSERLTCQNMKKTTLEHVRNALVNETHVVDVDENIRQKANRALERMISL
ncbi:quinolinate synthase NadA [Vallitalea pronyensis]|uniref:Quinolinate synthase n=1 Tax=Vallitalea pronyensis TaxID=1348613 RepID=A0A8J8MGG4_9FIRM|nr:quinolinate synthase NadA [Vallitalea pronyensis]QUI21096.1 quinolinate synthase NadA [Vallitalea pronyensis]